MRTSADIGDISAALAKAQGAMKNAALNKINPHFKSKFADLPSVRDAVVPALCGQGIAAVQTLDLVDGQMCVLTRLTHASGQWIESLCPIPNGSDMQKLGSAITYARRYSLSAICGIAADEDDDANAAVQATPQKTVAKAPEGFDNWLIDLESVADNGSDALKSAWAKSQPYLRKHLTDTDPAKWDALKKKAEKVAVVA